MMKQSLFVVVLGIFLFVTIGSSASLPLNNTIYEDETKIEKTENHDMKDFDSYQKQFRQEMLEAHNQYRARHCAPPLTLDNNLNNEAQKHAEHLIHINQVESSTIQDLNENRTAEFIVQSIPKYSGREATDEWYNETSQYDYKQGGFSMETSHFTQLVWKSSQQLGIGIAFNSAGTKVYVVARYSPPGNVENQYNENVFPPKC